MEEASANEDRRRPGEADTTATAGPPRGIGRDGSDRWTSPEPPVHVRRPMLLQSWRECAFLHWSFEPEALRPHIPPGFRLDEHDGRAWVGLISFAMPHVRSGPMASLRLPWAAESHLRTYVVGPDGRRGIWMLSLDIAPLRAALGGRFLFALPYWWAHMAVERRGSGVRYRVRRRAPGRGALDLDLELGEVVEDEALGPLDHFLTARWVLYGGAGPVRTAMPTEHPRWGFRRATVRHLEQSLTRQAGLPPATREPLVHFSDGVDAAIAWPRPFVVRGRAGL
jgi:uncharacterized protein